MRFLDNDRSVLLLLRRRLRAFGANGEGAIAIVMALSLPVVIGFVGLGVEVGLWFHAKRGLQAAADAAALSGAYERLAGNSVATATAAAQQAAAANGYDGSLDDVLTVNIPPLAGEFAGNGSAVEVVIGRNLHLLFSGMMMESSTISIDAYAVAILTDGDEGFCILALDPDASGAVSIGGNADVNLDCGIASNSSAADSVDIFGSADVVAENVHVAGGLSVRGASALATTEGTEENQGPIDDPYASIPEPEDESCDHNSKVQVNNNQNVTVQPGVYCGGFKVTNGGTLTFLPGVYTIKGGDLEFNGGTILGSDVFFFLTEDNGIYADITINGQASVTLSADPDGDAVGADYTGMLFMQDDDATGTTPRFNGGADMELTGVLYFPSQPVDFLGGADAAGCTVIVGSSVTFSGNSDMQIECEEAGVDVPTAPGNVALAG